MRGAWGSPKCGSKNTGVFRIRPPFWGIYIIHATVFPGCKIEILISGRVSIGAASHVLRYGYWRPSYSLSTVDSLVSV